jgi:hypothetical protein
VFEMGGVLRRATTLLPPKHSNTYIAVCVPNWEKMYMYLLKQIVLQAHSEVVMQVLTLIVPVLKVMDNNSMTFLRAVALPQMPYHHNLSHCLPTLSQQY